MIDPDVSKLRKALAHLQKLVKDGLATQQEASLAMGKMAESLSPPRRVLRRETPVREGSWLPTY